MSDPDRHLHAVRDDELDDGQRMTPEALQLVLGDLHSRVAAAAARMRHRVDEPQEPTEVGE